MAFLSTVSRCSGLLCLNTLTVAPLLRTPTTIEAWFSASLTTNVP